MIKNSLITLFIFILLCQPVFAVDPNDLLINSAYHCDPAGVKQALFAGADARVETLDGQTALMFLARCGDTPQMKDAIAHLIARGASPALLGRFGNEVYSACDIAMLHGNIQTARLLNKAGAPCRKKIN